MIAKATSGDARSQYQAEWRRNQTAAKQDIAPLPAVVNPERRASAAKSLRVFCETYFPEVFYLGWSANHLIVIDKLERAILGGDLFALAMPRASGKTSLLRAASLWAVLCAGKMYVIYIGANSSKAVGAVSTVKSFVRKNPMLYEDFGPELHGFWKLDNESRAAKGQRFQGVKTDVQWDESKIVFPAVAGSRCAGAAIEGFGIESGDILGSQHPMPDGRIVRPDLVIVDDPQTNESSKSSTQTEDRHNVINADVLGMSAPDKRLSAVVLCTVKQQNDLACRLLDRKQSPEWRGEKMQLLDSLPTDMGLWDRYAEIKHECERTDQPTTAATDFYRDNREAMDAGALPTWPARFDSTQISAVQYAMDLYYRNQRAFMSEYQNDPMERQASATSKLTPSEICERVNGIDRGMIPLEATALTAFIDVQESSLWFVVCWWEPNFSGGSTDYGVFPEQGRSYFSLNDVISGDRKLSDLYPTAGFDGQLFAGLTALTDKILGAEWLRVDGTPMKIDRCLIDANWGRSTKIVKRFCRQSKYASILLPSHGRFVGATSTPFDQYQDKPGERRGEGWRMPKPTHRGDSRHVAWDTNYYKSFFHARMSTAMGDPGAFTLFGRSPSSHRMFADHCGVEYSVRVEAKGRAVDEWKERPDKPDNHWFDGVVGCTMAATMCGVALSNAGHVYLKPKQRKTLEDMASEARQCQ